MIDQRPIVLIFEPGFHGHRGTYLDRISDAFDRAGFRCVLGTTECQDLQQKMLLRCSVAERVCEVVTAVDLQERGRPDVSRSKLVAQYRYWRMAKSIYKSCCQRIGKPKIVFIPYIDNQWMGFALLGSPFGKSPVQAISMRTQFHFQSMGITSPRDRWRNFRKFVFNRLIKRASLGRLYSIDPTLVEFLNSVLARGTTQDKIKYFADPIDPPQSFPRDLARRHFGLHRSATTIAVYGALDARKGIIQLLEAMIVCGEAGKLEVILAGEQDPDLREQISSLIQRFPKISNFVKVADHRLTDVDESRLLSAVDVMWVGYVGHYTMSGVLVKAAIAGLPIIGCNEGLIKWFVEKYKLGVVVSVGDASAVVNVLRGILSNKDFISSSHSTFYREHLWEHASQAIISDSQKLL